MPAAPSDLWTLAIDGGGATSFAQLVLDDGVLTYVNQQADTLDLIEVLDAGVTPDPLIEEGEEVVLARDGVVWFAGKRRGCPVLLDGQRTYRILGAWNVLERRAYLQNFSSAVDPEDPESALEARPRGLVVLGQAENGDKVDLTTFLTSVISYAGLTPGTIEVPLTIPFEDVNDLSCAEVIQRCLRWVPNTVVWFDYTTTPPTCHMRQRADLDATTLALAEGVSVSVSLDPRHDLVVDHVALFYVATNRSNSASWEVTLPLNEDGTRGDFFPEGTTGAEDGALVRTIQLGGSVVDRAYLTQEVVTETIPTALNFGGYITAASNPTAFSTLVNFWQKHVKALKSGYITIRRFESGTHLKADGDPITAGLRELIDGALTDWMQEEDVALVNEQQTAKVTVYYEVTDPTDASKKSMEHAEFSADMIATSAVTKTYSQLQSSSVTPAEPVPAGLAEALYTALNPLQYDGEIVIQEDEATARPRVGRVLNLAGDRAEYATMAALIQRTTVELAAGRTTITVGPARQLGPADLVEIARNNRERKPSTAYQVRATGKTGGGEGTTAPLPLYQPIRPSQTATARPPRIFTQSLTVAGTVPVGSEITTALQSAYSGSGLVPVPGDVIDLTVSGVKKFRTVVQFQGTTSGVWVVSFVVDGTTFYGHQTQTGQY